ncbi:MAG: hypothetical protein H8K04_12205 [Nitrospira sp.]
MEGLSWIGYWHQVIVACFYWAIELYPFPTLMFGVFITLITAIGFIFVGKHKEARNVVLAFCFGLAVCALAILGVALTWGPYIHLQQREHELKILARSDYATLEISKHNEMRALNETLASLRGENACLRDKLDGANNAKPLITHDRKRSCD